MPFLSLWSECPKFWVTPVPSKNQIGFKSLAFPASCRRMASVLGRLSAVLKMVLVYIQITPSI